MAFTTVFWIASPYLGWIVGVVFYVASYTILHLFQRSSTDIPFYDHRERWELLYSNAKHRFIEDGPSLLQSCQTKDWCTQIPGYEPFGSGKLHGHIVNDTLMKLTRAIPTLTRCLLDETAVALQSHWTDNKDWHVVELHPILVQMIAQVSSRVFLGVELSRDPAWVNLVVGHANNAFDSVQSLHDWPQILHNLVHWVLPACRRQGKRVQEARKHLMPYVLDRRRLRESEAEPRRWNEFNLLDCIEEAVGDDRDYDPAVTQLGLSFAAIHTTTDLLGKVLLDLCKYPELIDPLKDEIVSVVKEHGWQKTSLQKLKLMDSVLKETQRISPLGLVIMRRVAVDDITLQDGTPIPKGTAIAVTTNHMWESETYPNAHNYDGYRFLKWRDIPSKEHKAPLVSTGAEHLGFGHGRHACPGRFFAANEVKIVLCHILMKYDFILVRQDIKNVEMVGLFSHVNGQVKLRVKRHQEEIPLQ